MKRAVLCAAILLSACFLVSGCLEETGTRETKTDLDDEKEVYPTLQLHVNDAAYSPSSEDQTGFKKGEAILAISQLAGDPIHWDLYKLELMVQGTDTAYLLEVLSIGGTDYSDPANTNSEVGDIILLGIKSSTYNDVIRSGDYVLFRASRNEQTVWSSANAVKVA